MINFFKSQLLTLIFSWSLAVVFIILGGSLYSPFFLVFILIYSWVPGFVALHFYSLEKMRIPLKFKWNFNLLRAGIAPIILGGIAVFLSLPFSQLRSVDYLRTILPSFLSHFTSLTMIILFVLLGLIIALVGGYTLCMLVSLGQEMMWRGYLWDKLKFLGFWKSSIVMGLFWGIWHAPLILLGYSYPDHPYLGVFWIIFYSIGISPILLYYRLKSKTVVGSSIFNGVLNALSAISAVLFISPNYLLIGMGGVTGFSACILFNLLLFLKVRKNPLLEYEI